MTTGWGAAICLRCETVVHIRSRAQALISDDNRFWSDVDPGAIKPCKPRAS
jgi:hypothetical protein